MVQILPSIFGADILNIKDELKALESEHFDILHVDMMDGNFVTNIAFGPNQIKSIKEATNMIIDVHMMVQNPLDHLDSVIDTGADMISVHYESTTQIHYAIQKIKKANRKAGIVINPGTSEENLKYLLNDIDYILIMTISPGIPGQSFIEKSLEKIKNVKEMIGDRPIQIEIDGGVNDEIAQKAASQGADLIVVGGFLFKGSLTEQANKLKAGIKKEETEYGKL